MVVYQAAWSSCDIVSHVTWWSIVKHPATDMVVYHMPWSSSCEMVVYYVTWSIGQHGGLLCNMVVYCGLSCDMVVYSTTWWSIM